MSDLHVFRNDVIDWVITGSPSDADAVCLEHTGDPPDDPYEWTQLADDDVLAINDEDDGHVEKACREWVAEHGRGFFASTEY